MIISVVNHTAGLLSDAEVQRAIRSINRQIEMDFAPYWSMSATLRLEGHGIPRTPSREINQLLDMRGDAIIYLWHPLEVPIALGYHAANFLGIPFGYVFPALSEALGEPWTTTFSHEALEMIADPEVNLLVMGPHPVRPDQTVFHWYEVCDAVQEERYQVDGTWVSNFVLPLFFTSSNERGSRNDFLGTVSRGRTLRSFDANPGGYIGFFNPDSSEHEVYFAEGDVVSLQRLTTKRRTGLARRSKRYEAMTRLGPSSSFALRQALPSD